MGKMKIVAVAVGGIIVVIAAVGIAAMLGLMSQFGGVYDDIDQLNALPEPEILEMITKEGSVMAFVEGSPEYTETFEQPFVGDYTYRIYTDDRALEVMYKKGSGVDSEVYTCVDEQGLAQSFDVDVEAKIKSSEC